MASVTLEPLRDDDSDALFAWINDRELVEHSAVFRAISHAEHNAWFAAVRADPEVAIFAIRENGRLIGTCQLRRDTDVRDSAELRIRIGVASARDRGLGTEALRVLIEHGFAAMGLARIWLQVLRVNARAIRVYERAGFAVTGATDSGEVLLMGQGAGSQVSSSSER